MIAIAQSCFTGIESTPKITDSDVRRQKIETTPEDVYLSNVKECSLEDLKAGKAWIVTDPRISLVMTDHGRGLKANRGDTIVLKSIDEVISVTGEPVADFYFSGPGGQLAVYHSGQSLRRLADASLIEIPFAVEASVIEEVGRRMAGNEYYVTTAARYDLDGNLVNGRRFVKVLIDSVGVGNDFYPITLYLHDGSTRFVLYMSISPQSAMPRKFSSMFSLTDPRKRYPSISDSNWQAIVNNRIVGGMTRDEARLALGAPSSIDRRPGYSVLREIWNYENGIYIIFDDGIITSFRQ